MVALGPLGRAGALVCAAAVIAGCGGGAVGTSRHAATPAAQPGPRAGAQQAVTAATGAKPSAAAAEEKLLDTLANSPAHLAMARSLLLGDSLDTRGQPARTQIEPQAFRVADLPLVAVPPQLSAAAAPAVLPAGETPDELVVDWRGVEPDRRGSTYTSVRISLKGASYARLRVGGNETTIGNRADGGLYVSCSTPQAGEKEAASGAAKGSPAVPVPNVRASLLPRRGGAITPARWEMLTMGATVKLTVVDAWFDPGSCTATVVQRTTVSPRVLPGGVLYGYRTTCQARPGSDDGECAGDRESMVVLAPALTHLALSATTEGAEASRGMFTRATMPLQRGGGASLVSRVDGGVLRDWLGQKEDAPRKRQVLLGVEVVQGVADREAVAVSYAQALE